MRAKIWVTSGHLKHISIGQLRAKYNAKGDRILRYYVDLRHKTLDLHKELSAVELDILQNKVDSLVASWDKKLEEHKRKQNIAAGKEEAQNMTTEEGLKREKLQSLLQYTLDINDEVDWGLLKNKKRYKHINFQDPKPPYPSKRDKPRNPKISLLDVIFGQKRKKLERHAEAIKLFDERVSGEIQQHEELVSSWGEKKESWDKEQQRLKDEFIAQRDVYNGRIDDLNSRWLTGDVGAIEEHASMVLDNSDYQGLISKNSDIKYDEESKCLLVEFSLPSIDDLPLVKHYKFSPSTGELSYTNISERDKKALYDGICYQLCLRTLHELFEADTPDHLAKVLFNGVLDYVDPSTGRDVCATLLSVVADKSAFLEINLAKVEPKACFKSLKGVAASSLASLAPIAPIMVFDKEDKRFIDGKEVSLEDDGGTNLAAMDWEDFEHLVREVFEKEFSSRGGEVKVTQSSKDGGVDAVAFDPDPISGGKIVIQAKRYTRTVGVAAVRDLFGTTVNEGANKGILVTTADFGPDAYKFASDKPLSLMSGGNLLHLLERHGVKAKIDLSEAREQLGLK